MEGWELFFLQAAGGLVAFILGFRSTTALLRHTLRHKWGESATLFAVFALLFGAVYLLKDHPFRGSDVAGALCLVLGVTTLAGLQRAEVSQSHLTLDNWFEPDSYRILADAPVAQNHALNSRVLRRVAHAIARKTSVYASRLETHVDVRSSAAHPTYWFYDIHEIATYVVPRPTRLQLRCEVCPTLSSRPSDDGRQKAHVLNDPPVRSTLAFRLWPPLTISDLPNWQEAQMTISCLATLSKSDSPTELRSITLTRFTESRLLDGQVSSVPVFQAHVEITPDWDTIEIVVRDVMHPIAIPVVHYFVGAFCLGIWRFRLTTAGDRTSPSTPQPRVSSVRPVTSEVVIVRLESDASYAEVTFDPGSQLALIPEDAVVVSLNQVDPARELTAHVS